jgi:integrase/recombinase XerD
MSGNLFNSAGKRLYLTLEERRKFLAAADKEDRETRTFCYVLAYTGCRISEALALTPEAIDLSAGTIVFETLKKRRSGVYRAVPVPPTLLDMIELVHGLREKRLKRAAPLWNFGRTTAWKRVVALMKVANVKGPQATPKGLRHGFGVAAVQAGVPLNLLQRWLGHAQLTTTAIYANAVGPEERNIAARMWMH